MLRRLLDLILSEADRLQIHTRDLDRAAALFAAGSPMCTESMASIFRNMNVPLLVLAGRLGVFGDRL